MKTRADIQEDHIDFMQAYKIRDKQSTTITTNKREAPTTITNLKILSKNIRWKIRERMKPDSHS